MISVAIAEVDILQELTMAAAPRPQMSATPTSNAPLMFPAAAQPDILRCLQKDEYYLSQLQEDMHEVASNLLGTRSVAALSICFLSSRIYCAVTGRRSGQYKSEIDAMAGVLYYGLTAASGEIAAGHDPSVYHPLLNRTRDVHRQTHARGGIL